MKLHRSITSITIIAMLGLLLAASLTAGAEVPEKQWVVLHNDIPADAVRYTADLKYSSSHQSFCQLSQEIKTTAIPGDKTDDGYTQQIDIPTAADGYNYRLLFGEASDLNFLSRNSEPLYKIEMLKWKHSPRHGTRKEGYVMLGRDLEIPFQVSGSRLNIPTDENISGTFTVSIYSGERPLLRGSWQTRIDGQLAGSALTQQAALNISITCRDSLKLEGRAMSLEVKPFDKNVAASSASCKLTELCDIRGAQVAVEKIATDCSRIVLAVLRGDLNKNPENAPALVLNKPVPDFARVELIQRKMTTLKDLKTAAGPQGYIVMLFGDFKANLPEGMMGRPMPGYGSTSELSLDDAAISKILRQDVTKTVVVVFVCQRLPLDNLYGKWLDRTLDFSVLTDFGDPLNTRFESTSRGPGMYPGMYPGRYSGDRNPQKGTLRDFFGLGDNRVAAMLIDGKGDMTYLNKDAGGQFSETLTEINALLKK